MAEVRWKYVFGVAVFAWGLFLALGVVGLGIGTVVTNDDVIDSPQAGSLTGIFMAIVALIVFAVATLVAGLRRRDRTSVVVPLLVGCFTWCAYVVAALIAGLFFENSEMLTTGATLSASNPAGSALFFALATAARWPAIVLAVSAIIVTWGYLAMIARAVRLAGVRDFGTSGTHYRSDDIDERGRGTS